MVRIPSGTPAQPHHRKAHPRKKVEPPKLSPVAASIEATLSPDAKVQMKKLLDYAARHHSGSSHGRCYEYVYRFLTRTGLGKIQPGQDILPPGKTYRKLAHQFADFLNKDDNAHKLGLRKLDIKNPYDAPPGAIVVVAAGSPGTFDAKAGDISIAAGNGLFINDGPRMNYKDPDKFLANGGVLLGAWVPE
jgi:hypothetical protein